jgi:hypothetical protein
MGLVIKGRVEYRGVPKSLVLSLKENLFYNTFIETGTYQGETSIWASKYFENVITIEASKEVYNGLNLKKYSNITALYGNSQELLLNVTKESSIFYLDAHNSGGSTFNSYPLLDELDLINQTNLKHVIIVDDARFCMAVFNDESYGEITDICNKLSFNNRYVIIFDDMLIAIPREHKDILDNYTNILSKEILKIKWFNKFEYLIKRLKDFVKRKSLIKN